MYAFHDVCPGSLCGSACFSCVDDTGKQGGGEPLSLALAKSESSLTSSHRAGIAARMLSSTI